MRDEQSASCVLEGPFPLRLEQIRPRCVFLLFDVTTKMMFYCERQAHQVMLIVPDCQLFTVSDDD